MNKWRPQCVFTHTACAATDTAKPWQKGGTSNQATWAAMPEMARLAWAQAHCPNQAPGWPCETSWSSLLKNESHAIGGAGLSSQWQMWATARGVPQFHIDKVPRHLSCSPTSPCRNRGCIRTDDVPSCSHPVPLSPLLRKAGEEKQCSGCCACAISVPITFGDPPAQAPQGLLQRHSYVTLLSAHCPSVLTVA